MPNPDVKDTMNNPMYLPSRPRGASSPMVAMAEVNMQADPTPIHIRKTTTAWKESASDRPKPTNTYTARPATMKGRRPHRSPSLPMTGVSGVWVTAKPEKASPSHIPDAPMSLAKTGRIGTTMPKPTAITNMANHKIAKARHWLADMVAEGAV